MQEFKLVKSFHITFESKVKILDIVREVKAVELSDVENKPSEEEKAAQIDDDDSPGKQPPQSPTRPKFSSPDSGRCRFSRLALRQRGDNTRQHSSSSTLVVTTTD